MWKQRLGNNLLILWAGNYCFIKNKFKIICAHAAQHSSVFYRTSFWMLCPSDICAQAPLRRCSLPESPDSGQFSPISLLRSPSIFAPVSRFLLFVASQSRHLAIFKLSQLSTLQARQGHYWGSLSQLLSSNLNLPLLQTIVTWSFYLWFLKNRCVLKTSLNFLPESEIGILLSYAI